MDHSAQPVYGSQIIKNKYKLFILLPFFHYIQLIMAVESHQVVHTTTVYTKQHVQNIDHTKSTIKQV